YLVLVVHEPLGASPVRGGVRRGERGDPVVRERAGCDSVPLWPRGPGAPAGGAGLSRPRLRGRDHVPGGETRGGLSMSAFGRFGGAGKWLRRRWQRRRFGARAVVLAYHRVGERGADPLGLCVNPG